MIDILVNHPVNGETRQFAHTTAYFLDKVQFGKMHFIIIAEGEHVFIQGQYEQADTVTGNREQQLTRKWLVEPKMTESQVISTCFALCMASMEHRCREWFKYNGKNIYMPHYEVSDLEELRRSMEE